MSLGLKKRNGERLGNFALYRKNPSSPTLIDLEVLTASGFADAVAEVVERMQKAWFAKPWKEQTPVGTFGAAQKPVLASRMAAAMEMRSSG
jgi:hypothetical protein